MGIKDRRYTKVTQPQILDDLKTILEAKTGPLTDFGESTYGRTLVELFAANSDLNAAWIEEAFKDSFLASATSEHAIITGARSLGYSVRRPVPAKAGMGISLKRTGVYPNVMVSIPRGTEFSYGGQVLTAMDDVEFIFDRNEPDYENGLMKISSGRAVLAEGSFITYKVFSDGTQNQEFIVPDQSFSDWFGYNDPNYTEPESVEDRHRRFTSISSDASLIDNPDTVEGFEDKVYWRVSRRGFQDPSITPADINDIDNFVQNSISNQTINYTVLLSTANDGRAKIEFSDGIISAIPNGLIEIKYFSTRGELGNLLNVAGSNLNTDSSNILITQLDGTESDLTINDLNIALTTDIRGGLNTEDPESIQKNAPQIYNSLDSLGNNNSYLLFLKRIADVKYANAYGEDILNKIQPAKEYGIDIRYSNIVRFTLLKDLYREKDGNYFITDPFEYYVEGYKVNGLTYLWDYDYSTLPRAKEESILAQELGTVRQKLIDKDITILDKNSDDISITNFLNDIIKPSILREPIPTVFTTNLTPKDFVVQGSELDGILDNLNVRGYLTLGSGQHQYVHPIVHEMSMSMDVILFEGSNSTDIKTQIVNAIYAYLKGNTGFATPIYRSKIESLVQKIPEVAGLNLFFKEKTNEFQELNINRLKWLSDETAQFINQEGLSIDGFDATLIYDDVPSSSTENVLDYTVSASRQRRIRKLLNTYYNDNIRNKNVNEEMLNKYTAFIWATAMNEVYTVIYNQYNGARKNGDLADSRKLFNVIESLRGWYFSDGILLFKDTDTTTNMVEQDDNTLFNYKVYILEYIKLIRNILSPNIARRLINTTTGNVSKYSSEHEIVQFSVSASDITINTQSSISNQK